MDKNINNKILWSFDGELFNKDLLKNFSSKVRKTSYVNSQRANRSKIDSVDLKPRESAVINILPHKNNSSLVSQLV